MDVVEARRRGAAPLLVVAYAWLAAALLGAIVLDLAWAADVGGAGGEAGDVLLGIAGLTLLAGIGAVASAWPGRAGWLLLASLPLVVAELFAPALLSELVQNVEASTGMRVGAWIRLGGIGSASILALLGLVAATRRA
jgi:hypothetical protein